MAENRVVEVDGRELKLTNLDKVLYPKAGFTKAEVIDYYARIADTMIPHLRGRPTTLKRYPDGVEGFHFHIEFHPPLRRPNLLKYLAGPEIGGGNFLSDTCAEEKAAELVAAGGRHYKSTEVA